jgi:hypothetical protein
MKDNGKGKLKVRSSDETAIYTGPYNLVGISVVEKKSGDIRQNTTGPKSEDIRGSESDLVFALVSFDYYCGDLPDYQLVCTVGSHGDICQTIGAPSRHVNSKAAVLPLQLSSLFKFLADGYASFFTDFGYNKKAEGQIKKRPHYNDYFMYLTHYSKV